MKRTHNRHAQMLFGIEASLKTSSGRVLIWPSPPCVHEEVLDVVQTWASRYKGRRRTSVIIDLVCCGTRGAAVVALQSRRVSATNGSLLIFL